MSTFASGSGSTKTTFKTPDPGENWWKGAERGKKLFGQYLTSMFGADPDALDFTKSGMFQGNVFGGGEGGGFGGQLGQMMGFLGQGYDESTAAVNQSLGLQRRGALEAGKQQSAAGAQALAKRGLANSTVLSQYDRGVSYDTSKALADITAAADNLKSGLAVQKGQALAQGQQFGIGQQNEALNKLLAFLSGTAGYGPSGWNALFQPGGSPQVYKTKSKESGVSIGL